MVASGQTLMAGHCAAPLGPPTSCRPAIPRARSGGRVPRRDRIRIAAGRLARRAGLERHFGPPPGSSTRRRRSARRPDSPAIPRAFVRCSMPWTGWPRIPVQPGRSRTDRQTCGGCGPTADLPADTSPWHQCRAGISDQSFPRTTGTPRRAHAAKPGRRARSARRGVLAGRVPGTEVTLVDDPAITETELFSALPGVGLVEVVLISVADAGVAELPGSAGAFSGICGDYSSEGVFPVDILIWTTC
jgi:hypothetical protein